MRNRKLSFEVPQDLEGQYEVTVRVTSSKLAVMLHELKLLGIDDDAISEPKRLREPHPDLRTVTQAEYSARNPDGRTWGMLRRILGQHPDLHIEQIDDDEGQRIIGDLPAVLGWAQDTNRMFSTSIMVLRDVLGEHVAKLLPGERGEE